MINSFVDKKAEKLFQGLRSPAFSLELARIAYRKLKMLHYSTSLFDLRSPPSNRLEALQGDRLGQYSIRINAKWRICFLWENGNAEQVEIVDYH